jgi:hypothetical protein
MWDKIKTVLQKIDIKNLASPERLEIKHEDEALGCTLSFDPYVPQIGKRFFAANRLYKDIKSF